MRSTGFHIRRARRLHRAVAAATIEWVNASRQSAFAIGKGEFDRAVQDKSGATAFRLGRFESMLTHALINAECSLPEEEVAA